MGRKRWDVPTATLKGGTRGGFTQQRQPWGTLGLRTWIEKSYSGSLSSKKAVIGDNFVANSARLVTGNLFTGGTSAIDRPQEERIGCR
jgi:hypothetical protein